MSKTINEVEDWRREGSSDRRTAIGTIRRMAVTMTSAPFWRVVGHLLIDGKREDREAEIFSGIGFYGRPKKGHQVDSLVAFPGGASNPIIIATRDEDARRAVAAIAQDETAMFNSATIILIKANGTVEIRASGGAAAALATKADIDALKSWAAGHTHVVAGITAGGAAVTSATPLPVAPSATGTTVLKAQ